MRHSLFGNFTRKGKTLYYHVHYWPGPEFGLSGLQCKVTKATLLKTGEPVRFEQDEHRVRFSGLPQKAPDEPVTVIALECDGVPVQTDDFTTASMPRGKA